MREARLFGQMPTIPFSPMPRATDARPAEGYVLHIYGKDDYARHAVASVMTRRRHDAHRPVALYCTEGQKALLERHNLDLLFERVEILPEAHRSIVGFKHHLNRFKPYARTLFVDADMVWCKNPDGLWQMLAPFEFTGTGLERADVFFGASKGAGILLDWLFDRRRKTIRAFGLTHLPRVQGGMLYAADDETTAAVCELAQSFLARRAETHFRSRLSEGRSEESCEWSLACAMSRLRLPVLPWHQGYTSPQLDYITGLVQHDDDFEQVLVRYYCDRFVYSLCGVQNAGLRDGLLRLTGGLPGRGDYLDVTPYVVHFGWKNHKRPYHDFADRVWAGFTRPRRMAVPAGGDGASGDGASGDGHATEADSISLALAA